MKNKHTPGPWITNEEYRYDTDLKIAISTEVGARCLCLVQDMANEDIEWAHREARANAKLIAAAPDLLEALQKVLPFIKEYLTDVGHDPHVGINSSDLIYAIEDAELAIEKATNP